MDGPVGDGSGSDGGRRGEETTGQEERDKTFEGLSQSTGLTRLYSGSRGRGG